MSMLMKEDHLRTQSDPLRQWLEINCDDREIAWLLNGDLATIDNPRTVQDVVRLYGKMCEAGVVVLASEFAFFAGTRFGVSPVPLMNTLSELIVFFGSASIEAGTGIRAERLQELASSSQASVSVVEVKAIFRFMEARGHLAL